jgi:hypothetical protein
MFYRRVRPRGFGQDYHDLRGSIDKDLTRPVDRLLMDAG